MAMTSVIETSRLFLREMNRADVDSVAAMLSDPEVMRYWPRPLSRAEAKAWVKKQMDRYRRDGFGYWLVVRKSDHRLLGQAGIMTVNVNDAQHVGLGYIIHRPFWRNGFAMEAAAASLRHAFDTVGLTRVIALVRAENVPSVGVARKLGMKQDGSTLFSGFEHLIFALSREPRCDPL